MHDHKFDWMASEAKLDGLVLNRQEIEAIACGDEQYPGILIDYVHELEREWANKD